MVRQNIMKTSTSKCKYGTFSYFTEDEFVGKSLALYGEFSEPEVDVMCKLVKPGDTVLDIGANVGALTVPMAQVVGPTGRVIAWEPQPETYALLKKNIEQNDLDNVTLHNCGVGAKNDTIAMFDLSKIHGFNYGGVPLGQGDRTAWVETIDELNLDNVSYMKIDVEGMEPAVIEGASETIRRCRPFLYVENDHGENSQRLVSMIVDLGYRLYWHRPRLYSATNWRNEKRNVFSGIISINMICVPEELGANIDGCDEVADLRMDPQMYDRELTRFTRIVERNDKDVMAKVKNAKVDRNARLQMAHYANLTRRHDIMEKVLECYSDDPAANTLRGLIDLTKGIWNWKAYEERYKQSNTFAFGGHRRPDLPQWDGTPTSEVVLLWCEQGFGDTLMFGRFIEEALKRAPKLILEVQSQLYELFENSCVVPAGKLFRIGRTMPEAVMHSSIPSLAWALGADSAMIEKYSKPYLRPDPAMREAWLDKSPPKIGVCTKGSPRSERPFSRDIDRMLLKPLIDAYGPFMTLDNIGQFESFADTAAAISTLDLVITVDTSVAHLAGAMGKPTWLMMSHDPDFRWGIHDSSTIWYPNTRIFRQPTLFDWQPVIDEMMEAMETPDHGWHYAIRSVLIA